jgi:hypothetical protein
LKILDYLSGYKDVLISLRYLHIVCNTELLTHNYSEVLDQFSSSWFKLKEKCNISTTPKIHIILDHLEDYFDETQLSLLQTSDEIIKNMHHVVHKRLMRGYNVKYLSNPKHSDKLFNLVKRINTYNLNLFD